MFSDPISVTVASSSKSLPRVAPGKPGAPAVETARSSYRTASGDFEIEISQSSLPNGNVRSSIILHKRYLDTEPNDGQTPDVTNAVGLIFESNKWRYNTTADIADLRTALLALVDATFTGRLTAGES